LRNQRVQVIDCRSFLDGRLYYCKDAAGMVYHVDSRTIKSPNMTMVCSDGSFNLAGETYAVTEGTWVILKDGHLVGSNFEAV